MSQEYSRLAVENHFSCIQIVRADRNEVRDDLYEFNFKELTNGIRLPNYSTFDLLAYYHDSLHIDGSNYRKYFWKEDGHHNAAGYAAMAKGVNSCTRPEVEKILKSRRSN
jgi:lysophospholipase L1-like esterase